MTTTPLQLAPQPFPQTLDPGSAPEGALRAPLAAILEQAAALERLVPASWRDGPIGRLMEASRELREQLDTCDEPRVESAHETLLARQLERFSRDLCTARNERNSARSALQDAQLEALHRLIAAAELKDNDTGEHILRMGHFSVLIAAGTGQDESYRHMLLHASRMHDIGKIGIADAILKKPGKLTDDEWIVMRTHPQTGAALLSNTDDPLYIMAATVALGHHEKFDGSGYPNGVRGDAIPLAARIVALADFFDAVTMDRCYRPAMPDETALEMIRSATGSHFDPSVVEGFFRVLPQIIDVRARVNSGEML